MTVKFELMDEPGTYFLAWTTTPWTLPGNVALAVNPEIDYVKIKIGNEKFILAESRLSVIKEPYEILEKIEGNALVGMSYKPVFDYYNNEKLKNKENGYKVYDADFVTTEDGTGIVHIAPAFGEDDMKLGKEKRSAVHSACRHGRKIQKRSQRFCRTKSKTDRKSASSPILKSLNFWQEKGHFTQKKNSSTHIRTVIDATLRF